MKHQKSSFLRILFLCSLSFFTIKPTQNDKNAALKAQTDIIVFSYDRPMQLYALLESIEYYVSGVADTFIIFRTSDQEYEQAYKTVQKRFPHVHFFRQTPPYQDLKETLLRCVLKNQNPYIIFSVDDIIVKNYIDLHECTKALQDYHAHGFFLRLGKNLNYCYPLSRPQKLPLFIAEQNNICCWQFNTGQYDWCYPNNLDFTLYALPDLLPYLCNDDYTTPNFLEGKLMDHANFNALGLCYETSKIVNIPINIVQKDFPNNCAHSYSTRKLLDLFNQGLKINIQSIACIQNKSAHAVDDVLIQFIKRNEKE